MRVHAHRHRPESELAPGVPASRVLPGRQESPQAHAGEPFLADGRAVAGHSRRAARPGAGARQCAVRDRLVACARPRPGRQRSHVAVGHSGVARFATVPRARPRPGDDRGPHRGAAHQAGHDTLVAHHDAGRGLRGGGGHRDGSLRGHGLAAGASGRDPGQARRTAPG